MYFTNFTLSGTSFSECSCVPLFIQGLFVDPEHRHKGIGKQLVTALRDSFSTSPLVRVKPLVHAHTKMLNFYNSLGFESDTAFTFDD